MMACTRRKALAAVGTTLSLSGCARIARPSSERAAATTNEPSDTEHAVETHSKPTFVGDSFPLSVEEDANTVDELADASLVFVSPETSLSDRKLVDAVCGGSLIAFVGSEAGKQLGATLDEGNARQCLPYATEGGSGAVVAGVHPAAGELVTHYYGSSGDNTQQYKYSALNDLSSYFSSDQ
ncbi:MULTISPECIES: hypothetical protein [Halobacterium]|uniref:hypothetical protein n=1 Tax=Halobacterium TaxID=2239 RepID=UPI0025523848|nr:hypothetical protein [Halobacterium salinarum]MDL0121738.1 hypothetical protein [Halobacterium salinarum]MDL0134376.1 hypothetical protein [Halobacterium salinarum]